jgi:hypothetical protein
MSEMTREQWAEAWVEINRDGEEGPVELENAYQHGLRRYDEGGMVCVRCGKNRLLTAADMPDGTVCTGCMGALLASWSYGTGCPECDGGSSPIYLEGWDGPIHADEGCPAPVRCSRGWSDVKPIGGGTGAE